VADAIADEVLVKEFLQGNEFAFVNLYNRYKRPLYLFCLKMLGDVDSAKDIVQNVFLKVFERREQLHHHEKFKPWLFTIARNDCFTQLKQSQRMTNFSDEDQTNQERIAVINYERTEQSEIVNKAIAALKPNYREVIIMREYNNLSYQEIAGILQLSESAVKSLLFKARQTLSKILTPIISEIK